MCPDVTLRASRRGLVPPFIAMDVLRAANEREAAGADVIHLEVGQPGTSAPEAVLEAARRALAGERIGYTDALGIAPLRHAIARHYQTQYGVAVDPAEVIVTTGSSAAFQLAFLAAFEPGDRVGLAVPGYPAYRNILTALGIEPVLIEVCVDSVASAIAAERGGAQRIELCGDLLEGGVTPSLGLLGVVRSKVSIPVYVIIRPRAGDFYYSDAEFQTMQRDIENAKREGANGVVFGILQKEGTVDIERTRELVELARPLSVTFHRAFDMSSDLFRALNDVCATGADRLLTSGGEQECLQGVKTVARLVRDASGRIIIMAGGRIGIGNAPTIIELTGVTEIHVGLATPVQSPMLHQNSRLSLGKAQGREYQRTEVLEESVRNLRRAIDARRSEIVR